MRSHRNTSSSANNKHEKSLGNCVSRNCEKRPALSERLFSSRSSVGVCWCRLFLLRPRRNVGTRNKKKSRERTRRNGGRRSRKSGKHKATQRKFPSLSILVSSTSPRHVWITSRLRCRWRKRGAISEKSRRAYLFVHICFPGTETHRLSDKAGKSANMCVYRGRKTNWASPAGAGGGESECD